MNIKESVKWLWLETKGSRLTVGINCAVGVAYVTLTMAFVWCSKLIIDCATGNNEYNLSHLIALFCAIVAVQIALAMVNLKLNSYNSITLSNRLRRKIFQCVMKSRWRGKELFHTGDIMNRMESDVTTLANTICVTLPEIIIATAQVLLAFALMRFFDPKLAWIVLAIMPIALLLSKRYFTVMRKLTHRIRNKNSELQSFTQEHFQHRTLHIAIGNIDESTQQLTGKQSELLDTEMNRTNYSVFSNTMVRIGFMTSYIIAFVWCAKGLQNNTITYGVMAAFMQLVSQIQTPTINLSKQVSTLAQSFASIDRLVQLTTLEHEAEGEDIVMNEAIGVRLNNVVFHYDDAPERAVIDGLTHDFEPCKLHAIVGKSGVGKSTLTRMILALLTPQQGSVSMYDDAQEHICSPMTRNNIIYVPQGNTLNSGTVRDNLMLTNSKANDDDIHRAIHIAAAEFIYDLPNGLDTVCGESGAGLSEGQAQRVAIARSLLRPSRLVILDEPTAALDSHTEMVLIERLREYAQSKTLIIVTHRESTVALCDTILNL